MNLAPIRFAVLVSLLLIPRADSTELPNRAQRPPNEALKHIGIQLPRKTGKLDGVIDLPTGKGPFPIVILIVGSGPTDRDGNNPLAGKNDSLKQLGHGLARRGIAVLRYDRRGIGKSAAVQPKEDDFRFEMRVEDVVDWVKLLRKDPRFSRIALAGHSMGSLVGILAAQKVKVDGFIALAGFGRRAHEGLREQLRKNLLLSAKLRKECNHVINELAAGRIVSDPPKQLNFLFRPSVQPFLISYFKYDAAKEITKLQIPVLVVHGTSDLQHKVKEARLLAKANKRAKLAIIKDMNHVLKHTSSTTIAGQLDAYRKASIPLAPGLIDRVAAFLKLSECGHSSPLCRR